MVKARPIKIPESLLENTRTKLIDLIQNRFINDDGLVSKTYPVSSQHLLHDFDDYLPFMIHYGLDSFVEQQVACAVKKSIRGLIPKGNLIISWRQDEWFGALLQQYNKNRDDSIKTLIQEGIEYIGDELVHDQYIGAYHNLRTGYSPPIFDPRTGALIETFLDMGTTFTQATDLALRCLDKVVSWSETNSQWLIPNLVNLNSAIHWKLAKFMIIPMPRRILYPYVRGWRSIIGDKLIRFPLRNPVKLAKQNSNLIHAFIRAYSLTQDRRYLQFVENWFESFEIILYDKGCCFSLLDTRGTPQGVKLSHNHPVIECCLDLYKITGESVYLNMGVEVVKFWMDHRLPNGLFPKHEKASIAFLDDQTDMIVLLVRLAKYLNESQYLTTAVEVFEACINNHMTDNGLMTFSDGAGDIVHDNAIAPKYNALFLKSIIAIENHARIHNKEFADLMQDR